MRANFALRARLPRQGRWSDWRLLRRQHAGANLRFHRRGRRLGGLRGRRATSESGRYTVLLLEAGRRDRYPWIHIPLGYHKLYNHAGYNWKFESEPIAGLNNRTSYQPRGKMLGGTSSLNGLIYMRGTPADYDGWRQRGCQGWDYASVLPFFRKAENQERGENEFHGVGGPLNVGDQPLPARTRRCHHRRERGSGDRT